MVYIVFVNPNILGQAGMDEGAVFVATCIAAVASTFVMGVYAKGLADVGFSWCGP
jgi:AGZA family xanthine/uracil permease-like MFS transporter